MNTTANTSSNPLSTMPQLHQVSDGLLRPESAVSNSTREHASNAPDNTEKKVSDLRSAIDSVVDLLTTRAQKMTRQSREMATNAKERAQQTFNTASNVTTRYVSEQPLRSVLIAAGVGAAIALLVSATRTRNRL